MHSVCAVCSGRVSQNGNSSQKEESLEPVEGPQKSWRQLAFVLGEAALSLVSSGVLFMIISHVSGPELLGTYALAVAWLTLFQGISSFGIPEFLMREVGAYGRDAAGQIVHAILLGLGSGFVALCLMLAGVRLLGYSTYLVQVVTIASLALIPTFLNTACRSVYLALREMHLTFSAALVEVIIVMSASLYLLLSSYGAIALMVTLVVAKVTSASIALTLLYYRVLPVRPSFDLGVLMRTARTVFTFGIGNMLGMLSMRINTIMASALVDIATIGQFAAATKIMELGLIIPNLFAPLLMTRIAYRFNTQGNRDPNHFGAWYQVLFALVVPTCVGVWVFARLILETLFGTGFGNALWILRILMIYLVIESADAVMSVILKAAHRQREDVSRLAFNPLTNIVLNLVLLPTLGTIGAAIGRVGGVGASATLRYLLLDREMNAVNWFRFALKPALISIGVGSVCYPLLDLGRPAWLLLFYVAVTAVLLRIWSGLSTSAIKDMMRFPSSPD
jgi:O-antigen/teichoic acid export membrane protein